jgi:hypothetical protein
MNIYFNSIYKNGVWFDDRYKTEWVVFGASGKAELYRIKKETNTLTLEHICDIPMNDEEVSPFGGSSKTPIEVARDYLEKYIHVYGV